MRHAGCVRARCAFVETKAQRDGRDRGRAVRAFIHMRRRDRRERRERRDRREDDDAASFFVISAISASIRMPPNAPPRPQMHPEKPISQNEPTVAHLGTFRCIFPPRPAAAVDTGLRQLTPVNPGLPRHAIWQNEPTAAHVGTCRHMSAHRPRAPETIATSGISAATRPNRPRAFRKASLSQVIPLRRLTRDLPSADPYCMSCPGSRSHARGLPDSYSGGRAGRGDRMPARRALC